MSSNSSRLGVRGTESLGGGLNAIFQIESSINGDAGGGTLAGRETFVGLQGGWGTFKIGNFLAPYDDIHPIFGNVPTLTTSILSTAAVWGQGPSSKAQGGFDARLGNSVRYDSPNIAGFTGSVQVSSIDARTAATAWSSSMGGFYNAGPFQAGLAYERNEKVRGAGLKDDAVSLAGALQLRHRSRRGRLRAPGLRRGRRQPEARLLRRLGAPSNLGPGQLYAFWGRGEDGKGSAADGTRVGGLVKGADTGVDQYEISYTYPLSKRTLTYVGYVRIDNDSERALHVQHQPDQPVGDDGRPGQRRQAAGSRGGHRPLLLSGPHRLQCSEPQHSQGAFGRPFFALPSAHAPRRRSRPIDVADRRLRPRAAHARRRRARRARPMPGADLPPPALDDRRAPARRGTDARQPHRRGLRAGALRGAGARRARSRRRRRASPRAARDEEDHLAWTAARLAELDDRPSLLNPLWYAGSFAIGVAAGVVGDRANLGFVVETERQVEEHLTGHIDALPAADTKSRAIVDAHARRRGAPRRDGAGGRRRRRCRGRCARRCALAAGVMKAIAYRV